MNNVKATPVWARKSTLILLAVIAALLVFGTTTQTWIHVSFGQGQVEQSDLNIAGSKAAVSVSALALVALAGTLASTIAGKISRIITSVIVIAAAVGIIVVVLAILADPSTAAMAEVGKSTGVIGVASNASTTWFPVAAVAAAALLAIAAALILWFGRGWGLRSKYESASPLAANVSSGVPVDDIDSWDQLSRGEDPTD
ncbi:Trp biosynthesis-associated membrane protein [Arthrobacter cryoconiti]|uniref:Trp biosynthesis-associated membrane protein n=1 Tax=Arthrobacter cryoconiti TaxID=748907 RepID=A0ABV8QWA9_9MICC|nr:Trp biosynthesis-associated membrane protein [Arthrobacter cryoconiti]MCC9069759.1 Trp biosynthesis-associated membrane protein [Arthrobacter cryoconiti]